MRPTVETYILYMYRILDFHDAALKSRKGGNRLMKSGAFRVKRWISLGLLLVMVLSFAAPTFALPYRWYKNIYVYKNPKKMT